MRAGPRALTTQMLSTAVGGRVPRLLGTAWGRPSPPSLAQRGLAGRRPAASRTPVTELLVFLEARPDAPPRDQHAMLEEAWSTQFTWPGVLSAAGGRLEYPAELLTGRTAGGVDGFTHGVHFRFNSDTQALAFLRSQRVQGLLTVPEQLMVHPEVAGHGSDDAPAPPPPLCVRTAALAFRGGVESELEAIFRRGPEFAQGYELVLLLERTQNISSGSGGDDDASAAAAAAQQREQHFLSQLTALAQSSLAGAVQVSAGGVLPLGGGGGGGTGSGVRDAGQLGGGGDGAVVFMARFPSAPQLAAFRLSAPVQALRQQAQALARGVAVGKVVKPQLPLAAIASVVMRVNVDEEDQEVEEMGGRE